MIMTDIMNAQTGTASSSVDFFFPFGKQASVHNHDTPSSGSHPLQEKLSSKLASLLPADGHPDGLENCTVSIELF